MAAAPSSSQSAPSPDDDSNKKIAAPSLPQSVIQALPYKLVPKGREAEEQPCISNQAYIVDLNNEQTAAKFAEIKEMQADLQRTDGSFIALYDPVSHAYIGIVNSTGQKADVRTLIGLITANKMANSTIGGVNMHEGSHVIATKKLVPSIKIKEYYQPIRCEIKGSLAEPYFDIIDQGTSLSDNSSIINDTLDEMKTELAQSKGEVASREATFRSGSADRGVVQGFLNFIDSLIAKFTQIWLKQTPFEDLRSQAERGKVYNLGFLEEESGNLAKAAMAPKILDGTAYWQHGTPTVSDEDKATYGMAKELESGFRQLSEDVRGYLFKLNSLRKELVKSLGSGANSSQAA